jgi:VanZ family protein
VAVFVVFGWAWIAAVGKGKARYLWVAAAGLVFAALTELYQGILPWERTPDLADWAADVAGSVIASLTWYGRDRLRKRSVPPD